MVTKIRAGACGAVVLMACILLLGGCNVDLFGLFGSHDLDFRWQERETPHSLVRSDNLYLTLADEYSFVVLADTHIEGRDITKIGKLKKFIDDSDARFAVFCGDVTQNGKREDINIFKRNADFLGVPCFPVVGNHDVYFGNWPAWKEMMGPTSYRIDGDNTTLLFLDSANAFFGTQQLDWLEAEIKKTAGRLFVFTHSNLFVKSPVDMQQFTDVRERARITSMLKGRCDVMFMGHLHVRVINKVGGVHYISIEDYLTQATICHVQVTPDGVRWDFVKL